MKLDNSNQDNLKTIRENILKNKLRNYLSKYIYTKEYTEYNTSFDSLAHLYELLFKNKNDGPIPILKNVSKNNPKYDSETLCKGLKDGTIDISIYFKNNNMDIWYFSYEIY